MGLVLESEQSGRPLFSLLDEPYFFRKLVKPWILSGIEERRKLEQIGQDLRKKMA